MQLLRSRDPPVFRPAYHERFCHAREAFPNGCLITNASVGLGTVDEPLQNTILQSFTELEQLFYETLKKGQETGEIAPEKDIKMLSYLLLNLNHSINVMARIQSDINKVHGMMNAVFEML